MKQKGLLFSFILSMMFFAVFFQNCGDGFKSILRDSALSSENDLEPNAVVATMPPFMVNLDSLGGADRFYSVNSRSNGNVILAGQSEGFSNDNTKDAIIYNYHPQTRYESYHVIDASPMSNDQFFHMELSEPNKYLASGLSRSSLLTGTTGGNFTNDGLLVQYNAGSDQIEFAYLIGFIANNAGWQDIIRGAHKIGDDYFIIGHHGAANPNSDLWRPFIIRMDATGNIIWARNLARHFDVRKTAVLNNSIVLIGSHNDTGARTGGIYRVNVNGRQLWHVEHLNGGFWNGAVTSNGNILAAGNQNGNGLLVRFNLNGIAISSKLLVAAQPDNFFGIQEMSDGDIIATAHTESQGSLDDIDDALVLRLSPDLETVRWAKVYGVSGETNRIENAHNIAETSEGQIIFSGFSTPDLNTDDADKAFSFSLNSNGEGFVNCNRLQDATLTLTNNVYNGSLDNIAVNLATNPNAVVERLNIAQITRSIDDASLLQRLCTP